MLFKPIESDNINAFIVLQENRRIKPNIPNGHSFTNNFSSNRILNKEQYVHFQSLKNRKFSST